MNKRDLISITDLSEKEILSILKKAIDLKKDLKNEMEKTDILKNKTLVMIFEKPSLRTRLSFEIGMTQFGGHAVYLGPSDIGLGKRESVEDIAKVVSSMGDIIMARVFDHKNVEKLAKHSTVPVINGLSDLEHPCQILADFQTILEVKGQLKGLTLGYVGDCDNNMVYSLALGSALLGMNFRCAAPKGFEMNKEMLQKAQSLAQTTMIQTNDPKEAVKDADVVITDTWTSMGKEEEKEERKKIFKPYQVNQALMKLAKKDAIFMH
ncbi:MAG TPA: ornithine carbamoyltransferase, partial [Patescibacteria group bacterium]|nr:ornithine carbamoyltransferase [Patescibacteria group bacterium]